MQPIHDDRLKQNRFRLVRTGSKRPPTVIANNIVFFFQSDPRVHDRC